MNRIFSLCLILSFIVVVSACSDRRGGSSAYSPYMSSENAAAATEMAIPYEWFSSDVDPAIGSVAKKIVPVDHYLTGTSYVQSADQKKLDISALKMGVFGSDIAELNVELTKSEGEVVAPDGYALIKDKNFTLEDETFEKYLVAMTTETGQQIPVGSICRCVKDGAAVDIRISSKTGASKVSIEDCEEYLKDAMRLNVDPDYTEATAILQKWLVAAPCAAGRVELGATTIRKGERLPTSVASVDVKHICGDTSEVSVYIQKNRFNQYDRIACDGEIREIEERRAEICVKADGASEVNARDYYISASGLESPESVLDILQILSVKLRDVGFGQAVKK